MLFVAAFAAKALAEAFAKGAFQLQFVGAAKHFQGGRVADLVLRKGLLELVDVLELGIA